MEDYKHDMGLRIKQERKKHKLTQEQIAEMLDISIKHFSEVERGLTGLSIENLIKLSNILCVSIDYLVKGEVNKNKWDSTMQALKDVPEEKEDTIKELINVGIKLSVNNCF